MNDGLSMDDIYMDDDTTNGGGDGAQEGQDSQDPFAGSDPEADALFNGTETVSSAGTEPGVQSSDDGASGTDPGIQTGGQSSSDGGLYGSVARALMEDGILHISCSDARLVSLTTECRFNAFAGDNFNANVNHAEFDMRKYLVRK